MLFKSSNNIYLVNSVAAICVFVLCFTIDSVVAQKFLVIDSISNNTIPYVAIRNANNDKGFYSDQYGSFSISACTPNDTIEISCLGFETTKKIVASLKDTIYLIPKVIALSEIVIKGNKKSKIKHIGFNKKSKKMSFYIQSLEQLGVLLKPLEQHNNCFIKSIQIPINKPKLKIEGGKKFSSIFQVNLYKPVDFDLQAINTLKKPITVRCNQNSGNTINIDVSEKNIRFTKSGIFIAIQMIGEIDSTGKHIKKTNPKPSFKFTNKKAKNLIATQYYKFTFNSKWKKLTAEKLHLNSDYNLAIGISLNCY